MYIEFFFLRILAGLSFKDNKEKIVFFKSCLIIFEGNN